MMHGQQNVNFNIISCLHHIQSTDFLNNAIFYSETVQSVVLPSRSERHKPFMGSEDELKAEKRF